MTAIDLAFDSKTGSDFTIHEVEFCNLLQNPNEFEGKLVKIKAIHSHKVEGTRLFSAQCRGEVGFYCSPEIDCYSIFKRINDFNYDDVQIEAIGKFSAQEKDSANPNSLYSTFTIVKLINVKKTN